MEQFYLKTTRQAKVPQSWGACFLEQSSQPIACGVNRQRFTSFEPTFSLAKMVTLGTVRTDVTPTTLVAKGAGHA